MENNIPIRLQGLANDFPIHQLDFNLIFSSGIYFLCMDGEVVYIGQAQNVAARVTQHLAVKAFNGVFFLPCSKNDLEWLEYELIIEFKPKLNKTIARQNTLIKRKCSEFPRGIFKRGNIFWLCYSLNDRLYRKSTYSTDLNVATSLLNEIRTHIRETKIYRGQEPRKIKEVYKNGPRNNLHSHATHGRQWRLHGVRP
jgi:hypothetical protein